MRERYSRSGDNAKMKAFTFARNKDDLTDNSRTPTGTKIYFRSPSQNSLVLKFPNGMKDEKIERLPASELERLLSKFFFNARKKSGEEYEPATVSSFQPSIQCAVYSDS